MKIQAGRAISTAAESGRDYRQIHDKRWHADGKANRAIDSAISVGQMQTFGLIEKAMARSTLMMSFSKC